MEETLISSPLLDLASIEAKFKDSVLPGPGDEPQYPVPKPLPQGQRLIIEQDIKPAAVLVALVEGAEPTVLLTERTSHLTHHAGQVSFPGGRMEPGETPVDTALRETEEEIGLSREYVRIIGFMDKYMTGTGFAVYPIVARVRRGFTLTLDAFEVAEAFEVPLGVLMNEANFDVVERTTGGESWYFYETHYDGHRIWGATAGMLVGLSKFIKNK